MTQSHYLQALGISQWQQRGTRTERNIKIILIGEGLNKNQSLLIAMMHAMQIPMEEIGIETSASRLIEKLVELSPDLIIAMGEPIANQLLETKSTLGTLRGKHYRLGNPPIPLVVTYHPDELMHHPIQKKQAFKDLQLGLHLLAMASKAEI